MPTTDKTKNLQYVKKSQQKKKEAIGLEEFNRIHNLSQEKSRKRKKIKRV